MFDGDGWKSYSVAELYALIIIRTEYHVKIHYIVYIFTYYIVL